MQVCWRGQLVGHFSEGPSDMGYLEGRFEPLEDGAAFVALARSLRPREVLADPRAGTRVELGEGLHALVLGMQGDMLVLRLVSREEAVRWLIEHVR